MVYPGDQLEISYPVRTHVRFWKDSPVETRCLTVASVRDLLQQPLTVEEFLRRPFVARSRYLIKAREGFDWRQFYLGSSREYRSPATLQFAVFDPDTPKRLKRICRSFEPTPEDRAMMCRLIKLWQDENESHLQLRIICDDLRLVS